MNRVATPGYLRYPHIHRDLLAFVAEDDVWLAPADGGRAWRLTSTGGRASNPRFSPDGTLIAWTSLRDGDPEIYTAETDGGPATRRTFWGDPRTRTVGWTSDGEVLVISAVGQPTDQRSMAYAVPLDAPPRRLPFGQVNDLALTETATALLTARNSSEPAYWKRYRGGTGGRLWVATREDPLFSRVLSGVAGQFAAPMLIGGRLVFLADHEGTGNLYSCALDGTGLRRHTDHDGFYARNPSTDGTRIVYHVAGDIWTLDSLDSPQPRKLEINLSSPPAGRMPRLVTASDHLGDLDCDAAGQASVVEVRGTIHWLTHADGPGRALLVDPGVRARLPRVLGTTGKVAWITDAGGVDAIAVAEAEQEQHATVRTIGDLDLGNVTAMAASPDGTKLAVAPHDGRLLVVDIESGEAAELVANDDGDIEDFAWSPDSAWLTWAQPGPQPLARIRLARIADQFTVDVTDGRFVDSDPVFTADGLYLAFLSRRTFDPIYDVHSFDLSFPFGARPYLVPLAAYTLSPFGPRPGGRPVGESQKDPAEQRDLVVDTDQIASRVLVVPVDEGRYYGLRAVEGGLAWLRYPLSGVLGEGVADPDDDRPRPSLERFDLRKQEVTVLAAEVSWFTVSGDGSRLVIGDRGDVRVVPSSRKADNGSEDVTSVDLSRARFLADPAALWAHAYDEAGRLLQRDFWSPQMSGVDWAGVRDSYRFLLDRIGSAAEFADLLWEAGGELGTSHAYTYASGAFAARGGVRGAAAAQLGADLERSADGRWLVTRVLPAETSDPRALSPFAAPGVAVREGDEILQVGGRPVDPVHGPGPALAGTAGKPVELTIRPADPALVPRPPAKEQAQEQAQAQEQEQEQEQAQEQEQEQEQAQEQEQEQAEEAAAKEKAADENPAEPAGKPGDGADASPAAADASLAAAAADSGATSSAEPELPQTRRVVITPLHDDRRLRYQDWVNGRRLLVRTRSDGRVGYLHVPDMMGEGWAHLHRDLRAELGRDALIVDVRGNRGGHTSQLIVEKLARQIVGWKVPRNLRPYSYPQEARRGPLIALADEFAGSDGDIVTAAIRTLGLGPVIGTRTWGGVIGIDGGGHVLVDGTRITIPRYASWFTDFGWSVENYGVDPDTEVFITPDDWAVGRDPQLEVAVDRALALLAENPPAPLPDPATGPDKRRPPLPPRRSRPASNAP
jgi:tricorn protease